ncbi:MAG TPA: PaaI family thioesterase [Candidatus Dormibacteraeota bacterium]|nr:PaaI family thioesterase [Candidatus Dormibacteraeota bacterium]
MRGQPSPAQRWVGIEVRSVGEGEAVLELCTRPEMRNSAEMVHGGFIALLADSAMGTAMGSRLPDGVRHPSFDLKVSFIAPGRIGERLRAVAKVIHSGRRTGVAECRLTGEDGRLVATATATFAILSSTSDQSEA